MPSLLKKTKNRRIKPTVFFIDFLLRRALRGQRPLFFRKKGRKKALPLKNC